MAPTSSQSAPDSVADETRAIVTRLYRAHALDALRLALRYGRGDHQWAEDRVHDVFLEVHRHARRLDEMESPGAWIYRATTSRCLNRMRRDRFLASPMVRWIVRPEPPVSNPEVLGEARDELAHVFAAVNALPDKQRMCFWMYHVDGMTQPQIGEILGFRKSYVSKLLARAEAAVNPIRSEDNDG